MAFLHLPPATTVACLMDRAQTSQLIKYICTALLMRSPPTAAFINLLQNVYRSCGGIVLTPSNTVNSQLWVTQQDDSKDAAV
eukprot:scaffold210170_cov33-Prasinocladus_malaysianus.AAC.1